MTASTLRVRRATVEDLETLRPLWTSMRLSVAELEPRLTEFQVVENAEGKVMGAIGFEITDRQGRLHSDGYTDFAIADAARELLWKRAQTLAMNHGIFRIWTQENTPFWSRIGFKPADAEASKKLPAAWNGGGSGWLTLQLKDEAAIASLEKELAMYMEAEKAHSARIFQQGKTIKNLATIVVLILAMAALGGLVYMLMKRPDMLHPVR